MSDDPNQELDKLAQLASMERLTESLAGRDAGDLFQADLQEARTLAERDPRFKPLAEGLASDSLGERLAAINRFFKSVEPAELRTMELPMNLAQLRMIFLRSG